MDTNKKVIKIKKSYICYLNDNDEKSDGFVDILEINQGFVKFITNKNTLIIPINRILKIKEEKDNHGSTV